ncbi:MAG: hypothetical protein OQK04_04340, partial [Kangiellaceae bacterium]|nr:hypothetical protein [Kangiellaceae bacterium]
MDGLISILLAPFERYSVHPLPFEVLVGGSAVAIFFWSKFNTWVGTELNVRRGSVPKHYTTWGRFTRMRIQYTFLSLVVFSIFLASPEFVEWGLGKISGADTSPKDWFAGKSASIPLWSAFMLIVVIPTIPIVKKMEEEVRGWLHQKAMIPVEAKLMSNMFK